MLLLIHLVLLQVLAHRVVPVLPLAVAPLLVQALLAPLVAVQIIAQVMFQALPALFHQIANKVVLLWLVLQALLLQA